MCGSLAAACPSSPPPPAAQPRLLLEGYRLDAGRSARLLTQLNGGFVADEGRRVDLGPAAADYFTIYPDVAERRVCFDPLCRQRVTFRADAGWQAEGFEPGESSL